MKKREICDEAKREQHSLEVSGKNKSSLMRDRVSIQGEQKRTRRTVSRNLGESELQERGIEQREQGHRGALGPLFLRSSSYNRDVY